MPKQKSILAELKQEISKLYYSMSEVSEMFDVKPSLLRFWEKEFDIIQPKKNKKGNRLFTVKDIENLKLIFHLVKVKGYTLDGAKKNLKSNKKKLQANLELLDRLKKIRQELIDLKE